MTLSIIYNDKELSVNLKSVKIISVPSHKYQSVELCLKSPVLGSSLLPIAKIKLYDNDRFKSSEH